MNRELAEFLVEDNRPADTMNYPHLYGFLFAVASSPEAIDESLWMPMIFHDAAAHYTNAQQEADIVAGIHRVHHNISEQVSSNEFIFPVYFCASDELMENFDDDSQIAHWGRGFLIGHEWLEELWKAYLPSQMQNELTSSLSILGFFADKIQAKQYCASLGGGAETANGKSGIAVDVVAETVIATFDQAANAYAYLGNKMREALKN